MVLVHLLELLEVDEASNFANCRANQPLVDGEVGAYRQCKKNGLQTVLLTPTWKFLPRNIPSEPSG